MTTDRLASWTAFRIRGVLALCVVLCLCALGFASDAPSVINFDAPGGGTGPGQGTFAVDINAHGEITGWVVDGNGVQHGFIRTRNGNITDFDAPGAGTAA